MKIYVGHSRGYDYESELYRPIRQDDELSQLEIILPHENSSNTANSKDFYGELDLFIAEVSYPATGLGIELGWANDAGTPIVAIYRSGAKVSGSIHAVTNELYEYGNAKELTEVIKQVIQKHQ